LQPFRDAMVRMFAAGAWGSFSSFSRNYNGTYSSQRQELVEAHIGYQLLAQRFVGQWLRPIVRRYIETANLAGLLDIPPDLNMDTLFDVIYTAPAMVWIDPKKEADGLAILRDNLFESTQNIVRGRGQSPGKIKKQIQADESENSDKGLTRTSKGAPNASATEEPEEPEEPEETPKQAA
jgi:capsid protein